MKRKLLYTALYTAIIAVVTLLTGCKTNNGDIGIWYGSWALDRMTVDGTDVPVVDEDGWTNFAFQNNVVLITRTTEPGEVTECFGTWAEEDGEMVFDYNHTDDYDPSVYTAPAWLYFTNHAVTRCKILSSNKKNVTLQQVTADGRTITYYLRKLY